MFHKLSILLFLLTLPLLSSFAGDEQGTSGIVEENDLYIGVDAKEVSTITQEKFNSILDRISAIYAPIIEAKGKTLKIERKWDDGTVNAYAQQTGNTWMISMFGGLARHQTIIEDAFALVACHELGHHLGGAPKKSSWGRIRWASNEGQSDYFANSKCFRKFAESEDNMAIVQAMTDIPELVTTKCQESFSNGEDIAICIRGAMGGLSLGNLFAALRKLKTKLKFSTPDRKIARRTNHNHPAPQCRLDTYFSGSLCDKSAYEDNSNTNANTGVCARANGYTMGMRPLCWYKPSRRRP